MGFLEKHFAPAMQNAAGNIISAVAIAVFGTLSWGAVKYWGIPISVGWAFSGFILWNALLWILSRKKKKKHSDSESNLARNYQNEISKMREAQTRAVIKVKADETAMRHNDISKQEELTRRLLAEKDAKIAELNKYMEDTRKAHSEIVDRLHYYNSSTVNSIEAAQKKRLEEKDAAIQELNRLMAQREQAHKDEMARLREERAREVEQYQQRIAKTKTENDAAISELTKQLRTYDEEVSKLETLIESLNAPHPPLTPFARPPIIKPIDPYGR